MKDKIFPNLDGNELDWYGTRRNATYGDAIATWLRNGGDFDNFINSLGKNGKAMSDVQLQDLQKQLLDMLFNRFSLEEQRQYDSPSAMLQRLMQTGMSRDAALALLSGSGSGSGDGSSSVPVASAAPSQSNLADVQAKTAIANTVFSGLSAISGLASVGAQIPLYAQQATQLGLQNSVQQSVMQGNQSVSNAHSIIQSALEQGVISGSLSEFTTNKESIVRAINGLAEKGYKPAEQFVSDGLQSFINNPYTSGISAEYYHTLADPERYMMDTFNANRAAQVLNELQQVNIDEVLANIEKLDAEVQNLIQDTQLKRAEELNTAFNTLRGQELLPLEKRQVRANIRNLDANTRVSIDQLLTLALQRKYMGEQVRSLHMQNDATEYQFFTPLRQPDGSTRTGLGAFTRNGFYNLFYSTQEMLQTYGNPKWFNNRISTMLQDAETLNTYSYLQNMYSGVLRNKFDYYNDGVKYDVLGNCKRMFWWYNIPQIPVQSVQNSPAFIGSGQNQLSGSDFLRVGLKAVHYLK